MCVMPRRVSWVRRLKVGDRFVDHSAALSAHIRDIESHLYVI